MFSRFLLDRRTKRSPDLADDPQAVSPAVLAAAHAVSPAVLAAAQAVSPVPARAISCSGCSAGSLAGRSCCSLVSALLLQLEESMRVSCVGDAVVVL